MWSPQFQGRSCFESSLHQAPAQILLKTGGRIPSDWRKLWLGPKVNCGVLQLWYMWTQLSQFFFFTCRILKDSHSCSIGARIWYDVEPMHVLLPCSFQRSCWGLQDGHGSWALVPNEQLTQQEGSREMQSVSRWSEPSQAVLQPKLWRALPFYRQTVCTKVAWVESMGWVSLQYFPEAGRITCKVSLVSEQFILVFVSGIYWWMLTVILRIQTLFW